MMNRTRIACFLLAALALHLVTRSSEALPESDDSSIETGPEESETSARVEHAEPASAQGPVSLAITVSGGVSLGAYQAGYLYYLTETAKLNPRLLDIRLVTGASAGMINALLTLLAMGERGAVEPEDSLFYRVWNRMRYDEFLDVERAPPKALSSRAVLEEIADDIESVWNAGLSTDLDMVLGAATTRLKMHKVEVGEGISVPTQQENFVFRVQGRGAGKEPALSNYVDKTYGLKQPLLPFLGPDEKNPGGRTNFSVVRQILFASSAIPIVFLPQEIEYCTTDPKGTTDAIASALKDCPEPKYSDLFVDGAIVDRKPLRLAHRIARSGLQQTEAGTTEWLDNPDVKDGRLPDDVLFLYIDPSTPTYPEEPRDEMDEEMMDQAERLFRTAGELFKAVFTSTRGKELYTLLEEHPEVTERILMARHDLPTMSGLMVNFFGFFDREIRKFDFYLGMRDARQFVEKNLGSKMRRLAKPDQSVEVDFPDPDVHADKTDFGGSWRPYFCLRAVTNGEKEFERACRTGALRDFRILLQATLDRLYDHCRRVPYEETIDNHHCKLAMSGASPPRVWRVPGDDHEEVWRRRDEDDENQFEHTMRLLEKYEFHFRDLGLDRDDASFAMLRIREELLVLVDTFAKKLRFGERLAIRLIGKPAINFFVYAPPQTIFYLVMGKGAEIALSTTLGKSYWLRFNFALQGQGLNLFLTEKPNAFALTPAVGLEAELYPASTPLLQTRVGARMGYQFSTEDRFLTDPCNSDSFRNDPIRCSAPVGQAFLALVFYERVRLQLGLEWYPRWLPPMNRFDKHLWNGLIEVGWQWISPF
jgi:predicted acylesterase/phospholipase RssA